jgi:hypothetical protein
MHGRAPRRENNIREGVEGNELALPGSSDLYSSV